MPAKASVPILCPRRSAAVVKSLDRSASLRAGIDERSVKRHRTNLMRKLEVTSVAELAQLVFESGAREGDSYGTAK
jgi:hypothetical protein